MLDPASKLLLACSFTLSAEAAVVPNNAESEVRQLEKPVLAQFLIERDSDRGTMIGDGGAADVTVYWGNESVSFVEITPDGAPTMTTIDFERGKPLPAVHSRHTLVGGLVPSQMYGSCVVK